MPALATTAAQRDPRRVRSHIPGDTPRRGELAAALVLAGLLAHLFLAQLTLLLAVALDLVSRVARWRPHWLAALAVAGFLWVLAIGPGRALAGFTAGPQQVLAYLSGVVGQPARVLHPGRAFAGIGQWLPRQVPLALILAPAEAAMAWWLRVRRAGGECLPPARAGLIVAARRQFTVSRVRAGGVVSRTGACLGVDWPTGRPAGISWRAAEGGVLVTGPETAGVSAASFQLAHAAIRRRKPVLIVDLRGLGGLPAALAAVCADAGAPLHVFGPAAQGCYEPLRGGGPARKAALVMGMIDWDPVADHARRTSGGYLNDLFAVAAAAPGDPRVPVLDDVAALLAPDALRARMRQVPSYHPRRVPLGERVRVSASLLEADPATASFLAGELTGLRASALGRWLRPAGPVRPGAGPGPEQISVSAVVRDRAVAFFPLDQSRYGRAARMIANLVALDVTAVFAEARRLGTGGDGLAWFGDGEAIGRAALAQLISTGSQAGLATVVSTVVSPGASPAASPVASPGPAQATGQIAALANVLVISGPGDPVLSGLPLAESALAGAARTGTALADGEFALVVRGPGRQVLPRGRFVPGRMA
ncbi:MAG TPA: hypothetical protein VIK57_21155 [Streptosporangiaceae bacterium]